MDAFRKVALLSEGVLRQQRPDVFRKLLSLGLAGAGIGATGRTLAEMLHARNPHAMPFVSPGPSVLSIPVPAEEEQPPRPGSRKFAAVELAATLKKADWAETLSKNWPRLAAKIPVLGPGLNTLEQSASHANKAWWNVPAAAAVGGGSLAAGWGLSDWLLDRNRKQEVDEELQQAKTLYQQALTQPRTPEKTAAVDKFAAVVDKLDRLFETVEKRANPEWYASSMNPLGAGAKMLGALGGGDAANGAMGAYMTALGALTGGAGYAGYRWAKGRSQRALLDKALRARSQRLWSSTSQPIETVPAPMRREEAAIAA